MDIDKDSKIKELEEKVEHLEQELQDTKARLQKYTFNDSHKTYKEKNKEKILEYAKQYYQKKKLKNQENN
jgi:hypothetical protein